MRKSCQSCGMRMKKDPQKGGSNIDGTVNTKFCSFCFENGKFLHTNFTVKDMQVHCIDKITEAGMPKIIAWLYTRGIPRLNRWSTKRLQ